MKNQCAFCKEEGYQKVDYMKLKNKKELMPEVNVAQVISVRKQSVYFDTNCCDFKVEGRPHDRIDWGGTADTNHMIY